MKKQIPNILSCMRLIMIPLFVVFYFKYDELPGTFAAACVYMVAWMTDALDGYLARRNNWITDVGKILDPLADKLMQCAAAVCFTIDNPMFFIVLVPLLIKEFGMLVGALAIMRKRNVVVQSSWYGKLATVLLFLFAFLRTVIRDSVALDIAICVLMLSTMMFSLVMYYVKQFKGQYHIELFHKQ